jgi:hypothetical protein
MKIIQCRALKNYIILSIFLLPASISVTAQVYSYRLQTADSLFERKHFTQSLELYEGILQQRHFTPAMLLKMAYIHEGLNDPGKSLYYLNLYYLATKDALTLEKMEQLAKKHNLTGYEESDLGRARSFFNDQFTTIALLLSALLFLSFSMAVYSKRKKQRPIPQLALLIFFAIILTIHLELNKLPVTGIISQPDTYLMSGPSAGATIVTVLQPGHRVEITGKEDVWTQINFKGTPVYVKESKLVPVHL